MTNVSDQYAARLPALQELARCLEAHVSALLHGHERIESIRARAKSLERFVQKASAQKDDGDRKYANPLDEIQDQVGVRVVTYYLSDVDVIAGVVDRYLRSIESKLHIPDDEKEFGYIGRHFILVVPSDVKATVATLDTPEFFELQVQTLFQHAWAESEHDLGYKPSVPLTPLQKRQIAFTAAQAWGADQIFEELHQRTRQTSGTT